MPKLEYLFNNTFGCFMGVGKVVFILLDYSPCPVFRSETIFLGIARMERFERTDFKSNT